MASAFSLKIMKSEFTIPKLAEMLAEAKAEKAKTIVPKFAVGQLVHRSGYSNYSGEILDIDIEIRDDGEPLITYTIDEVGTAWEEELEISKGKYFFDY